MKRGALASSRTTSATGAGPADSEHQPEIAQLEQPGDVRRRQRPQLAAASSSVTPSSPTSTAPRSISASARLDLPLPGAPSISTPRPSIATQLTLASTVRHAAGKGQHQARAGAVFGIGDGQRAVVRFGDGAADREAEAAVVAEILRLGPQRVEAGEDFLARVLGDPGPLVADARSRPRSS